MKQTPENRGGNHHVDILFPPNLCPDNFFKRKTSLNLLQYFFLFDVLVFWPGGTWDLSSTITDGTCTPCTGRWSLTTGRPGTCLYSYHFIQSYLIIWPSFDFSFQNLLTRSLKTLWSLSYLEHVLLCVNSKHVFQASTDTLCDREDPVSVLSGTQLWAWRRAQRRSVAPALIERMNQNMDSCVGEEGMVCV